MILIDEHKKSFRGNTHAHTTVSDGRLSPETVIQMYAEGGYDFLVLSDHWRAQPTSKYADMLVMTGTEFDFSFADQVLHIVGVFPDEAAAQGFDRSMTHEALIRRIRAQGGAAIVAHPSWSMNTLELLSGVEGVVGAEVYNSFSGVPWNAPRADSTQILDLLSTAGRTLPMLAADDSHFYQGEQMKSWTMVQADALCPESIIAALKEGAFYASQGPRILSAEMDDRRMIVHTDPVCGCCFSSNLPWVDDRCRTGAGMTEHVYEFRRNAGESFVRCELWDEAGRRAWLSPVKLV